MAKEAALVRLAPVRADFHHGPERTSSLAEAGDTFAVRLFHHYDDHDCASKCHVATAASRPEPPSAVRFAQP